jgi:hypothetical protein
MPYRRRGPRVLALALLGLVPASAAAFRRPDRVERPDVDVRLPASVEERGAFALRRPSIEQLALAEALARELPGLTLRWDGMAASPRWISAPPGATLSGPMAGPPEVVARAFLRTRAALFGLSPREAGELAVTSVVPGPDGAARVHLAQRIAGI